MNNTVKTLRSIERLLEMRQKSAQTDLDNSVKNGFWSQVAGWNGIETGLLMALKDIRDEIKLLERKKK